MKHIVKRWDGTDCRMCGQLSLAMATDKSVDEVVQAVEGRRGGTTITLLLEALMRLGFRYESINEEQAHVGRGIAIIEDNVKRRGHAVAWEESKVYDPDGDEFYHDIASMQEYFASQNMRTLTILRVEPVKMREWAIGKQKEEAK